MTRLLGFLQPFEWKLLDLSLRWRPAETTDPRITIIEITEDDLQPNILPHPPSDQALADLIQTLQVYSPRAIGIDIFRDGPVKEGYPALVKALSAENVIVIDKVLGQPVAALPFLPTTQVGFADFWVDTDGFVRRGLLGINNQDQEFRFSFGLQLVRTYLAADNIELENGLRDPQTMRFAQAEIPRFQPNTGGYVRTQHNGNQMLLNPRTGVMPFDTITYQQAVSADLSPALVHNRVVMIGYTAPSVKDFVSIATLPELNPSLVPGVYVHAHIVSQLLSAVYEGRPFLKTLPNGIEYLLIFASGGLGVLLVYWHRKPLIHSLLVGGLVCLWLVIGYGAVVTSWWLPIVPTLAAFLINVSVIYPFYQTQLQLRSQLNDRQQLITQTFNAIHNGPLNTLSELIRSWHPEQPAPDELRPNLQALNQELRNIYNTMRQEMLLPTEQLILTGQQAIDLQMPLDELLRETYHITLERRRDFFEPILKIVTFEPMDDSQLNVDQKRDLGRFLEEALLNVHRYARTTTRLTIKCYQQDHENIIQVSDNGEGIQASQPKKGGGYGTQQSRTLARHLSGQFERREISPQGVCCELRWPAHQAYWKRWLR